MPLWGAQSGSHMQWCHAIQILVVHIGAVGQQVIHHLQIAEIHRILGPVVAKWKTLIHCPGYVKACVSTWYPAILLSPTQGLSRSKANVVHVHIFKELDVHPTLPKSAP